MHRVLTEQRGGVLTLGAVLALYFSSSGVESLRVGPQPGLRPARGAALVADAPRIDRLRGLRRLRDAGLRAPRGAGSADLAQPPQRRAGAGAPEPHRRHRADRGDGLPDRERADHRAQVRGGRAALVSGRCSRGRGDARSVDLRRRPSSGAISNTTPAPTPRCMAASRRRC